MKQKMKKVHSKKRIFLVSVSIIILLFLILFATPTSVLMSAARGVLYLPSKIYDVKKCESVEFYVNEEVIEDSSMLEGEIVQIQDKKTGKKQHCYSYFTFTTTTTIQSQPTPSIVKIGTKKYKDPNLLALAPSAGIKNFSEDEPVSLYYVDNYTDHLWAAGQYSDYKKAITVKKDSPFQRSIFAHEYLHYVWYRDNLANDPQLVDELNTFYKNNSDLQQRMIDYNGDMISPTEFFSYGCTEWSANKLTPYILQNCERYISRRNQQISYY